MIADANYLSVFESFKGEIDSHYDRRERIIKLSRDITALSKKMIFSLLRVPFSSSDHSESRIPLDISKEVSKYEKQIMELISKASVEMQQANVWRYQRQISPGIQEFIEALTLRHYIQSQSVPGLKEMQALVGGVELTPADYVLGLADLTGELTRRAIATLSVSTPQSLEYTTRIATCLRQLTLQCQLLDTGSHAEGLRELGKKIVVMESSLMKVEKGIFEKSIR